MVTDVLQERSSDDAARAERSLNLELGRAAQFSKQWHVGGVCITTGVKLRRPEGAQRPRASSASTSELGSWLRSVSLRRDGDADSNERADGAYPANAW
jgi:hypothetical protein